MEDENASISYFLGTDALGRDILSKIIAGARVTVLVVLAAVGTGIIVGTTIGLVSGYFGGIIDDIVMRFVDAWNILPGLLIILVIVLVLEQSLETLIIVLAIVSWPGAVRLVRAETLSLKNREYVALARVAGASNARIMIRHILPGVVNIVIVTATLGTGNIILLEASLSYLGAGIPPPEPSWGRMISEERQYIDAAWWTSLFPGLVIAMVVMSGNFLGDWFRDRVDPTLRQL
ncbi:MAG: ABC transporter permease [Chloroflexi bacterium]|nr:ABC transporter permease [Chloroflexota bacterium]